MTCMDGCVCFSNNKKNGDGDTPQSGSEMDDDTFSVMEGKMMEKDEMEANEEVDDTASSIHSKRGSQDSVTGSRSTGRR